MSETHQRQERTGVRLCVCLGAACCVEVDGRTVARKTRTNEKAAISAAVCAAPSAVDAPQKKKAAAPTYVLVALAHAADAGAPPVHARGVVDLAAVAARGARVRAALAEPHWLR